MNSGAQQKGVITSTITLLFDQKGRVREEKTVEQFTPVSHAPRLRSPKALPFFSSSTPHGATESLAQELKALAQLFFKRSHPCDPRRPKPSHSSKEESASWTRLMTGCRDLKRELAGQLSDAENSITVRKSEWKEAKNYCDAVQTRGLWKTSAVYTKKRAWLQKKMREKPDPNRDLDREIVLGVASPTSRCGEKRRFVSLEDMTPGRLKFISKAAKRGFGDRPLDAEQLITNLETLHTQPAAQRRWESQFSDSQETGCKSSEKIETEATADSRPRFKSFGSGSPVNDFISLQQHRFFRSPVSRITVKQKRVLETKMNHICSSPDIRFRVQQIEEAANQKRLRFLRTQTGQASSSSRLGYKPVLSPPSVPTHV